MESPSEVSSSEDVIAPSLREADHGGYGEGVSATHDGGGCRRKGREIARRARAVVVGCYELLQQAAIAPLCRVEVQVAV